MPKGWTLPDVYGLYRSASHIKLTCKYLGFQSIRFKFHDRIKQRPISFQSAIPETTQGDNRLCVLIDVPNHHTFYTCSTAYKKQGAPDQRSTHLLLLSAHISPRTKSKGLHMYVLQNYYFINQVFKSFCSSAGIIIDGLALP
jgi:hypothetical protein